jgi:hypothetical protein
MTEQVIRFAVANDDRTLRSASWKCWTPGGADKSVYLTCRELGNTFHTSLHQSGNWHTGFASEKFTDLFEDGAQPSSRFIEKWTRPNEIVPGWTLAARIYVPWNSLVKKVDAARSNVVWVAPAPQGTMYEFVLLLGASGTDAIEWPDKGDGGIFIGSFEIGDGSRAVVGYRCVRKRQFRSTVPSSRTRNQ